MNPLEQRVLDAIDVDGMLEYLCDLVAVRSVTGDETAAQEHVARQMERCGLKVDLWELDFDRLRQHRAFSIEIEREHGLGVVGIMGNTQNIIKCRYLNDVWILQQFFFEAFVVTRNFCSVTGKNHHILPVKACIGIFKKTGLFKNTQCNDRWCERF